MLQFWGLSWDSLRKKAYLHLCLPVSSSMAFETIGRFQVVLTEGRRPRRCGVMAGFRKESEVKSSKLTPSLRERTQAVKEDHYLRAAFLCAAQRLWSRQFGCSDAKLSKQWFIWRRMQCNEDMAVAHLAVKPRDVFSTASVPRLL